MKWISVKDMFPANGQIVITYCPQAIETHCILVTMYSNQTWCQILDNGFTEEATTDEWEITHWMPLPEPPKKDQP